jgi:predicted 2-oxoglutarate/Fe(II)-dependent dioxygenase YbiX
MNSILKQNNYVFVPGFIERERSKLLSDEFKKYANENKLCGDSQAENSQTAYNFIGFLELLCEKTPEVSKFLGEPVLPTYCYARVYKEGSDLKRHRDREACEISLTLNLSGDSDWPIYIQRPDGSEAKIDLNSGDAMMYLGCDADHWRGQYDGKEYVQVFLHYVRSRGDNSWATFDKERIKPHNWKKPDPQLTTEVEPEPEVIEKPKYTYSKNIEDYIVEFEDIIPDSLCDAIMKEYSNDAEWSPTYIGRGVVDKSVRNVNSVLMSQPDVISRNLEYRKFLDQKVFEAAATAIKKYNEKFPEAKIEQDSGYELLRYDEGFFYKQHTDSFKAQPRAVSCSFALNDDYEGGEFAFFDNEFYFKLKKGSVLMFPSNFMYPHEILPVTKGTRYSIITWFI